MLARLRYLLTLSLLLLGISQSAQAQTQPPTTRFGFDVGSVAKLVQGADTLPHAWAGGLNAPQFSSIDLNYDGQPDLYAFDRQSLRSYTFLNVAAATGPGRRWQYAPLYESAFPQDLDSWVVLCDYDCDGKADMFTYFQGGIRVFRNTGSVASGPRFTLASAELYFALSSPQTYNLAVDYYNMPAIQDVNSDGRLDILTYDPRGASSMELYLNGGTGTCTDLGAWQRVSNYWGLLQACADCRSFLPNGATQCLTRRPSSPVPDPNAPAGRPTHSQGHNLLLVDLNGDGVLDLLDGRDNCPQLTRLLNGGTNVAASFTASNISSNFPLATPLSAFTLPAPYLLDADFDGVKDLVVVPNQYDNSVDRLSMRHSVRQFRNTSSASAIPSFTQVSDGFLQNDMMDVSEGAAPAFGDLDGDGLVDMLVGNHGDLVNGYYRASLAYYRNVGTAHRPVFRLVTDDYLGLAATAALTPTNKFEGLRPALVDLNQDGALDLVYSVHTGTTTVLSDNNQLRFILNTAPAGLPASFNPTQSDYLRAGAGGPAITGYAGDTPCFFDVDGDGLVDLLLGTNDLTVLSARLYYYRNQGSAAPTNSQFALADNDYGTLRNANGTSPLFNLSPAVADFDGDGRPDLLTTDGNATVRFYSDFRNQGSQFTERTDLFFKRLTSTYAAAQLGQGLVLHFRPVAADLNQDGTPELYIGTEGGGIVSYLPGSHQVLASRPAAQALALSVYPNPADLAAPVTIETAQPTSLCLYDLTGRLVRQDATAQRRHTFSLSGLAVGLYVAQVSTAEGTVATQKLLVTE
ncbi:MAG: T9SS type A sorting domain-containing protein [Janthinobacterium lividum]